MYDAYGRQLGHTVMSEQEDLTRRVEISSDGQSITRSGPSLRSPCITFFSVGIDQFGIRNNCDHCVKAVVEWTGVGIQKYAVQPRNQIILQLVSNHGQLIGEDPC